MTRHEFILRLVLNGICDDFEDIERILPAIEEGKICGVEITYEEVLDALRELIDLGYAKAWDLYRCSESEQPREDIDAMTQRFARTEAGLAFLEDSFALAPQSREERVSLFILNLFRDFNHRTSLGNIERASKRDGMAVAREELIHALRHLLSLGYVRADYKDEPFWQYPGMPPLADIKPYGAYFWATGAGWDFLESDRSWWPWDDDADDRVVRKGWTPPT